MIEIDVIRANKLLKKVYSSRLTDFEIARSEGDYTSEDALFLLVDQVLEARTETQTQAQKQRERLWLLADAEGIKLERSKARVPNVDIPIFAIGL